MIHLILDNWSVHKTKSLKQYCENNNIQLHYIPTGAPYFNRIESALFGRYKDELLKGSNFENTEELKKESIKWMDDKYNQNAYHKIINFHSSN